MQALKTIYNERSAQANSHIGSPSHDMSMSGPNEPSQRSMTGRVTSPKITRKRKYHEMSVDSPVSSKNSLPEEEEKEVPTEAALSLQEYKLKMSRQLFDHLKQQRTDEDCIKLINSCLDYYDMNTKEYKPENSNAKKMTEKEKRMVKDAIKKLTSDNSILKRAVLKYAERENANNDKMAQCEQIQHENAQLKEENQKLWKAVELLKCVSLPTPAHMNEFMDYPGNDSVH